MRRLTGLALMVLVVVPATGCIRMLNTRSDIRADPLTVERHAETVFAGYLIPVTEHVANNRVESGWFAASDVWGPDAIRERVDCGFDAEGMPATVAARVELSVTLRVAYRNTGTRIGLDSTGRTVPGSEDQDSRRCRLSDPFAQELLTAIAGQFPGVTPETDAPGIPLAL